MLILDMNGLVHQLLVLASSALVVAALELVSPLKMILGSICAYVSANFIISLRYGGHGNRFNEW